MTEELNLKYTDTIDTLVKTCTEVESTRLVRSKMTPVLLESLNIANENDLKLNQTKQAVDLVTESIGYHKFSKQDVQFYLESLLKCNLKLDKDKLEEIMA